MKYDGVVWVFMDEQKSILEIGSRGETKFCVKESLGPMDNDWMNKFYSVTG